MTRLPDKLSAPDLKSLELQHNCLSHFPQNLSSPKLKTLNVSFNKLTGLPANLLENPPPKLKDLYLLNNRLTSVPNSIVSLPAACVVDLGNNPLPDNVRNRLFEAIYAADYSGPGCIYFSMAGTDNNTPARPLEDAVADWYGTADKVATKTEWRAFAQEEENKERAAAFSKFLDRLKETVNYDAPGFTELLVST